MIGRIGILVFVTLLFSVLPAGAEVREWTDEQGVKHFSNENDLPEGVTVERIIEEKDSRPGEPRQYRKPVPAARPRASSKQTYQPRPESNQYNTLREIRIREAKLRELFDRIYTKRRYVKRHGKQDIDRIRRLSSEIDALEKKGTETARIKQLKEERTAARERLFNENLRTRKGVGADIQEYQKIKEEIAELKKSLER